MHWWYRPRLCFGAAVLLCIFAARPAFGGTASELVKEFHSTLLTVVSSTDELQLKERYEGLAPRVHSIFNVPLMMQVVTGRHWLHATEDERANLVDAYARLTILIYASRIATYAGEQFEMLGEHKAPNGRQLVLTRLVRIDAGAVPITYELAEIADGWRVVDIIFGRGISELALRQSEYRNILVQGGITALTQRLDAAADRLLARPPRLLPASR